ncbi:MAG: Shikimate dehydrogenase [Atribacteria bacterium 34_128]|nr:MAG: Shikimate dehydrogenase [Atribacteria bacterium 34_128]
MSDKISIIGLLGEHIENSISPFIHHKFIRYYSINYCYVPFQIKTKELPVALTGARTLGICGLNVTIPFKKSAMKFIDNNDLAAERIGAINTIVRKDEKLYGYNTDWIGFKEPLAKNGEINFAGKKAVVLGAGGAARAVVYALAEGGCSAISIFNRSEWRAVELKRNFQHIFPQCEIKIFPLSGPALQREISEADLLINATPLGSWYYPGQNPLSEEIKLPPQLIVYDLIYYPDKTPLLRWAEKSGNKIINGKEMLVYQAVESFYLWTNIYPEQKIINQTISEILEMGKG